MMYEPKVLNARVKVFPTVYALGFGFKYWTMPIQEKKQLNPITLSSTVNLIFPLKIALIDPRTCEIFAATVKSFHKLKNFSFDCRLSDSQDPVVVDLLFKLLTIKTRLYIDFKMMTMDKIAKINTLRFRKKYFFVKKSK